MYAIYGLPFTINIPQMLAFFAIHGSVMGYNPEVKTMVFLPGFSPPFPWHNGPGPVWVPSPTRCWWATEPALAPGGRVELRDVARGVEWH